VSTRWVHRLLLVAVLALIALVVVKRREPSTRAPGRPASLSPLALVPRGPAFVMTVDVARLRASPFAPAFARFGLMELVGTTATCRFDPLRDLSELVITSAGLPSGATVTRPGTPGESSAPAAVIGAGRFAGRDVADCASARIAARGGQASVTTLGSFSSVRDRELPAEVAARDGLLVLSEGRYLRDILDIAEGRSSQGSELDRLRDHLHAELRRTFGRGAPVLATVVVPEGWIARAFGPDAQASPLAAIRSAALRVEVGERISIAVFLGCLSEKDCLPVVEFLRDTSRSVAPLLGPEGARLLGSVSLQQERERIELSLALTGADVVALSGLLGDPR
jgi:hypothetical protein